MKFIKISYYLGFVLLREAFAEWTYLGFKRKIQSISYIKTIQFFNNIFWILYDKKCTFASRMLLHLSIESRKPFDLISICLLHDQFTCLFFKSKQFLREIQKKKKSLEVFSLVVTSLLWYWLINYYCLPNIRKREVNFR